jgi:hypothetical protein
MVDGDEGDMVASWWLVIYMVSEERSSERRHMARLEKADGVQKP